MEELELTVDFAELGIGDAALYTALILHEHLPHNPDEHDPKTHHRFIALLDEFLHKYV